jgi:16S rRNA C1402 (ribose-2'-O) methylase RsmI
LAELADWAGGRENRGEMTLVVEGAAVELPPVEIEPAARMARALVAAGLERSRVAKAVGEVFGLSRNESYRLVAEDAAG